MLTYDRDGKRWPTLSERYFAPHNWRPGHFVWCAALTAAYLGLWISRGPYFAAIQTGVVGGMTLSLVVIIDTWDLVTRTAHTHWTYWISVAVLIAIFATLYLIGAGAAAVLAAALATLLFGILKAFRAF